MSKYKPVTARFYIVSNGNRDYRGKVTSDKFESTFYFYDMCYWTRDYLNEQLRNNNAEGKAIVEFE